MQAVSIPNPRHWEDISPYRPVRIGRLAAERARRLSVRREPAAIGNVWAVSLVADPDAERWAGYGETFEIDLCIDGETAHLRAAWSMLEAMLHQAEPRLMASDLGAELGAYLLESHLADGIEKLEQHTGADIAFARISASKSHDDLSRMDLRFSSDDQPQPGALFASPRILGVLAAAWEQRPILPLPAAYPALLIAARVAFATLSRKALTRLAVGDALFFDRVAPDGGVVMCLGEHLFAQAQIDEDGNIILGESLSAASPLLLGDFSMTDEEDHLDAGTAALEEADVASLPVKLVFEVGRKDVSLDELRGFGVGAPIPLDRPATTAVDILANGRRIGAGEIVLIGEQLGVRITRLNGHA